MTRERFRFGAVLFNLIAQVIGGVLVFGFTPQIIFADIGGDELAQLCLRLAVYSNASMILVVALVLRYAPQPRLLRWLAAGGALYHILAGTDAVRTALGFADVTLVEPVFGPTILHSLMFLVLIVAALIPEKRSTES